MIDLPDVYFSPNKTEFMFKEHDIVNITCIVDSEPQVEPRWNQMNRIIQVNQGAQMQPFNYSSITSKSLIYYGAAKYNNGTYTCCAVVNDSFSVCQSLDLLIICKFEEF